MLRNKKILILGARGFVGKNLLSKINLLENSVTIISRENFSTKAKIIIGDLTVDDEKTYKFFTNFDVIFNCSGELTDEKKMNMLHIEFQKKVINFLSKDCLHKRKKTRWIQVSSIGVFGINDKNKDIIYENTEKYPSNYYEKSKLESEKILISGVNEYFEYIILRPSTIYGKNMKSNFIQKLNHFIKKKYFFYIDSKETIFNLIHIDDVSSALILCAKNDIKNETFNLSCNYKLEEIVHIICEYNKIKKPSLVIKENIIRFVVKFLTRFFNLSLNDRIINILTSKKIFDSTKIEKLIEFKPRIQLSDGIIEVLNK
jgi:nucleoside-diphosphate-sugar epimerase